MPRLSNRSPRMYRNGRYAAVKIDGSRIHLGRWGSPQARQKYDCLIAQWLSNGRRLPVEASGQRPEDVTVTAVLLLFWRQASKRYTPGKRSAIKSSLRVARRLYGTEPATKFGPRRLSAIREVMVHQHGWSRSYVNEACQWIRRAFRYGAAQELIPAGVYRGLMTLEPLRRGEGGREPRKVRPVSRQHVRVVRPHLARPVRGLIALQLLTGARPGELVNLKAADLETSGVVWTFNPVDHKTAHRDHPRTIYFGPRAQHILRIFMARCPADKPLFDPREANAERKRVGAVGQRRVDQKPNAKTTDRSIGEAYTVPTYRRAISRACSKAGIAPWSPHQLRHATATQLRRQFGLDVASIILGHRSLAVTSTYAELDEKRAVAVMSEVG